MNHENFGEACPKLEASQDLEPGVGTLLYLGDCYEHLGRRASAWATFSTFRHARVLKGPRAPRWR